MSSADKAQLRHDVPRALVLRLQALRDNSLSWHDWWQAGVLLSELAESARRVRYNGWLRDAQQLLLLAQEFFDRATTERSNSPKLAHRVLDMCAIRTDRALALARCLETPLVGMSNGMEITGRLKFVIDKLNDQPLSDRRSHHLAIAHGFIARVHWWEWFATGKADHVDYAREQEQWATSLFRSNLRGAQGDHRQAVASAFASHMVVMALAHSRNGAFATRWSRCRTAATLAREYGDRRQVARAFVVALFGNMGERCLRRLRDKPHAIKAAISEAQAVLNQSA